MGSIGQSEPGPVLDPYWPTTRFSGTFSLRMRNTI